MKKAKNDIIFSVILLLFTGFVYLQSNKFPIEAAVFPRIFSIMLAILTFMLLVKSITEMKAASKEEVVKKENLTSPTLIIVGLAVYAALINVLGYIVATIILSAYVIYVLGYRDYKKMVLTSVTGTLITYLVFKIILGVNLPEIIFMA